MNSNSLSTIETKLTQIIPLQAPTRRHKNFSDACRDSLAQYAQSLRHVALNGMRPIKIEMNVRIEQN
jgi:hypothetical protein